MGHGTKGLFARAQNTESVCKTMNVNESERREQ